MSDLRAWLAGILSFLVVFVGIETLKWALLTKDLEFRVVDTSLTHFNLTKEYNNSSILDFNLSLVINVTNPNKKGKFYNKLHEARAFYEDKQFGSVEMTPFEQPHENTTILRPIFHGQASVHFGKSESSDFNRDKSNGSFDIQVKLYGYTYMLIKMVECDLKKVPLVSNGSVLASRFLTTDCKYYSYRLPPMFPIMH